MAYGTNIYGHFFQALLGELGAALRAVHEVQLLQPLLFFFSLRVRPFGLCL